MIAAGVLIRDAAPCYYVYRLTWRGHTQTGLAAVASIADYNSNRIRKHEHTTPVKEDDRVRQIEAINAQTGPVMIGYPSAPEIDAMLVQAMTRSPQVDVVADDGVRHQLWVIDENEAKGALTSAVDTLPALYIADGHHRAASAARARAEMHDRKLSGTSLGDGADASTMLAVAFPHDQVQILSYNRTVKDLGGLSADDVLAAVRQRFDVVSGPGTPARRGDIAMYFRGAWQTLRSRTAADPKDPIGSLDVSVLQEGLLASVLGIADVRTDKRIEFVGGAKGTAALEQLVDSGKAAVAFSLFPVNVADLMAVADAGEIMPPKSTWFEPKLRDGLLIHLI
jgi:uncharacterized protein (DUF1015 family)